MLHTFIYRRTYHPPGIRHAYTPPAPAQVMALYEKIQNEPLHFPPEVNMSSGLRRLLTAMMEKEPANRIPLEQV